MMIADEEYVSLWLRTPNTKEEAAEIVQQIKCSRAIDYLPDVPRPSIDLSLDMPGAKQLKLIQEFICSLEYNHTKEMYFHPRKIGGVKQVCSVARQVIEEALPIQCVEATYLGVYLTQNSKELRQRLPLFFRSFIDGHVYKHVVLAVQCDRHWGAIGLSRKDSLMNKDLSFKSFSALVAEFKACYEECGHVLLSVKIGLPFQHDSESTMDMHLKAFRIVFDSSYSWETLAASIDIFAGDSDKLLNYCETHDGKLPADFAMKYCLSFQRNARHKGVKSGIEIAGEVRGFSGVVAGDATVSSASRGSFAMALLKSKSLDTEVGDDRKKKSYLGV